MQAEAAESSYLQLGFSLQFVHRELGERLLQNPGLAGVELPLLLQNLGALLVVQEPEGEPGG